MKLEIRRWHEDKRPVENIVKAEHVDGFHENAHLILSVDEVIWIETPAGVIRISTILPADGASIDIYGGSTRSIPVKRIK